MPEHDSLDLDTFDLDAAFRALEHDIAQLTDAPGATAAVTRARRRRGTTIGALAAAAALVIGGGVVLARSGGDDPPVAPVTRSDRPAVLDAAHLTAATAGWTSAWTPRLDGAMAQRHYGGSCFPNLPGERNGGLLLRTADGALAQGLFQSFGRQAVAQQAAWTTLQHTLASCPQASTTMSFTSDAGQGITYRVRAPGGSAPAYIWIVNTGTAVGVLKISGQGGPLPSTSNAPITAAVLAAAAAPATYPSPASTKPGKVSRIDPTKTVGNVWPATLRPALAGWQTPWDPHASGGLIELPACTDAFTGQGGIPQDWHTSMMGGAHYWVQWHRNVPRAVRALDQIQADLEQCATPYTFHSVTLDDGRPILVGTGGAMVFWATRVSSHILVLALPAGPAAPSDDVSRAVGAVLEHVLEQPATTTMAPGSGVPGWMKPEIAAAPTFGP